MEQGCLITGVFPLVFATGNTNTFPWHFDPFDGAGGSFTTVLSLLSFVGFSEMLLLAVPPSNFDYGTSIFSFFLSRLGWYW